MLPSCHSNDIAVDAATAITSTAAATTATTAATICLCVSVLCMVAPHPLKIAAAVVLPQILICLCRFCFHKSNIAAGAPKALLNLIVFAAKREPEAGLTKIATTG